MWSGKYPVELRLGNWKCEPKIGLQDLKFRLLKLSFGGAAWALYGDLGEVLGIYRC